MWRPATHQRVAPGAGPVTARAGHPRARACHFRLGNPGSICRRCRHHASPLLVSNRLPAENARGPARERHPHRIP